jgi:Cytochrome P460
MNVSARSSTPRDVPAALFVLVFSIGCGGCGNSSPTTPSSGGSTPSAISSDAEFLALVTQTQSFRSYAPFPNLDTSAAGTLAASSVHQPIIRVSMNSVAAGALQDGRLPAGSSFPDGSVLFKEVLGTNGLVNLYTVMYKDRQNALAANGWLWAELRPNGGAEYSVRNRGGACTSCHALDRGPQNDFVRSFERQR